MSLLNPGLEAFMAIVDSSTVHGAADNIGLTQTGVTQRIRALEKSLSTTLFTRSRKGMLLTSEGEALFRYCQRSKEMEGEVLSQIRGEHSNHIRLKIIGPSSLIRSRLVPNTRPLKKKFPKIRLTFQINDESSGVAELKAGLAQFAIIPREEVVLEFDSKLLKPEKYILVASSNWKKRSLIDILTTETIVDFEERDQLTTDYLKKHKLSKYMENERHYINNTDALAAAVIEGSGYSVLSEEFTAPYIKRKELIDINPGKSLLKEFALCWYPRHQMPDYFKEFTKLIY